MTGMAVAVVAGSLALLPAGASARALPGAVPAAPGAAPTWLKSARAQLSKLKVKPAGSMAGYEREKFGPAWKDVDQNGCDTRNDILDRDLKRIVFRAGSDCIVATGILRDPYTATTIKFVRGVRTSSAVQIDHVVALAAAWRTGARRWTATKRLYYANDRLVLLAVDGPTNGSKSDSDAADWLPPKASFRCRYVARQISIKRKYVLWVTRPEKQTMTRLLRGC